jgi:hypothetical protein
MGIGVCWKELTNPIGRFLFFCKVREKTGKLFGVLALKFVII